jgi:hypothetical protein
MLQTAEPCRNFGPHTWAVDNEHAGLHNSALRYDQSSRSQAKEPVPDAALKYVVGKKYQRREPGTPPLPNSWALVVLAVTSFAASGRQRADKGIWTSALRLGGDAFGSEVTAICSSW